MLSADQASAAPAAPVPIQLVQPDGSTFTAFQWGDEWNNGYETRRGFTIVEDDGRWEYAKVGRTGHLVATGREVGRDLPPGPRHLRPSRLQPSLSGVAPHSAVPSRSVSPRPALHTGTEPMVVLLAEFTDQTHQTTKEAWAASTFGGTDSVADYYDEVSYGALTIAPATESHGTVNDGVVGWLDLGYDHPNTAGNLGAANDTIVAEAITAADPYVDFSAYDDNLDDVISPTELHLSVIVAGYEASYDETCGNSVWGHRGAIDAPAPTVDGVTVGGAAAGGGFTQFGEMHCDHISTLGIMAHELGHDLDLPDLYDTDHSSQGVGYWSLMAAGSWLALPGQQDGSKPSHLDAFSKYYQGWLDPTPLIGNSPGLSLGQVETGPNAYRMLPNPYGVDWRFRQHSGIGDYYLLENRQAVGYDAALPGCGVLIWHIDESVTQTNAANASDGNRLVDLVEADGLSHLDSPFDNAGDDGDPYPGSTPNPDFDVTSIPSSGGSGIDVEVTSGSCASSMTMNVVAPDPVITPADASTTESDSGTKVLDMTVSLSDSSASTVTADWMLDSGSAYGFEDFDAASGTVTFAPGDVEETVPVTIHGDTDVETDETFFLTLSNPSGGAIADTPYGIGTILNDDDATATSLSIKAPKKVRKGSKVTISGVLSSSDPTCIDAQWVDLWKGPTYLNGASTSSNGAYSFSIKVRKKLTIRTVFDGTTSCGASTSDNRTIKVF